MATAAGLNGYLTIAGTEVTAYMTDSDFSRLTDLVDSTTFGDTAHEYTATLAGASLTFNVVYETTLASLSAVLNTNFGISAAYVFGPTGNTAGEEKFTFNGFIESYGVRNTVAGIVTQPVTVKPTGAITRTTF